MLDNNFYTYEGKLVNDRIRDGRTEFFTNLIEADAYAREKKSYHYPLYDSPTTKRKHIGYGVPK